MTQTGENIVIEEGADKKDGDDLKKKELGVGGTVEEQK